MPHPRIFFFGTPEFAIPSLHALIAAGYNIAAVVTQPDKPVGRGLKMEAPPVKRAAMELEIPILQPFKLSRQNVARGFMPRPNTAHEVPRYDFIGICVAYGKIIPQEVLKIFPKGILNIHPSLLPKYRGPSPIQTAILNGDTETGVTIMLLDEKLDHGPILIQSPFPLAGEGWGKGQPTAGELSARLAQEGAKLLVKTLPKYLAGKISPRPQDHSKATFTKMLERADGKIDWEKPAEYIERMVRAYDLWPGTWTMLNSTRLKVLKVSLFHQTIGCASNATPGYVWKTDDNRLAVNCNPGSVIFETLQREGKKSIAGTEFMRGYPKIVGSLLK